MPGLTPRQAETFNFIRAFISQNKYPPSQRQIATELGFKAVRSVQQLLGQLERKGFISHTAGVGRSLRVVAGP